MIPGLALAGTCRHLTLLNRRGTDPYARWCRIGATYPDLIDS